jgi:hypothetical protein
MPTANDAPAGSGNGAADLGAGEAAMATDATSNTVRKRVMV